MIEATHVLPCLRRRRSKPSVRIRGPAATQASFAKKALERLNLELFRNVSVHDRLKALITLEQV